MPLNILIKKDPVQKARMKCRKKFLYYFKKGYADPTYVSWERQYKLDAHFRFQQHLDRNNYLRLLDQKNTKILLSLRCGLKAAPIFYFLLRKWPLGML